MEIFAKIISNFLSSAISQKVHLFDIGPKYASD